jgi:DNA-binding HxlR family transcriptional regulator
MAERSYGQFCGLARALDLIGERWALLVVRDLLVGPRRFTDLKRGLPKIPTNVLSTRLKDLEEAGVVTRRLLPRSAPGGHAGGVVYELTPYGRDLEDVVLALGAWGARRLGEPRPGEVVTADSMVVALRAMFQPVAAAHVRASVELRLGDVVVHARIGEGDLDAAPGPLEGADLVLAAGPGIRALFAGELAPEAAVGEGVVEVLAGDPALLAVLPRVFRLEPAPEAATPR